MEPKKRKMQMNLFTKQKRVTGAENKFMVTTGERLGGDINWEIESDTCILSQSVSLVAKSDSL